MGAGHSHSHDHAPADYSRAFALGIVLNLGIVILETVFGLISGSMALLADAGHNLSDVLGLVVAFVLLYDRHGTPSVPYSDFKALVEKASEVLKLEAEANALERAADDRRTALGVCLRSLSETVGATETLGALVRRALIGGALVRRGLVLP